MNHDSFLGPPDAPPPAKDGPSPAVSRDLEALLAKHGITSDEGKQALLALVRSWAPPPSAWVELQAVVPEKERFRQLVIAAIDARGPKGAETNDLLGALSLHAPSAGWPFEPRKELYVMADEGSIRCVPWYTTQQWFRVQPGEKPAEATPATTQPTTATDKPVRPLTKTVLEALGRKPQSEDSLFRGVFYGQDVHPLEIAREISSLLKDRFIEADFPYDPLPTAALPHVVYRLRGEDVSKRAKELETENATLRRLAADNAKMFNSEAWKVKMLEADLKHSVEAEGRARKDARDNQATANNARETEARLSRELADLLAQRSTLTDQLAHHQTVLAKDTIRIGELEKQLADAKKAAVETIVLGPREWVIRKSTAEGRPSMHQKIYPKLNAALAHMAQHDKDVSTACRLVPYGTPSIPLSLINEVLTYLRGNERTNTMVLADRIDAALDTGLAREQATT